MYPDYGSSSRINVCKLKVLLSRLSHSDLSGLLEFATVPGLLLLLNIIKKHLDSLPLALFPLKSLKSSHRNIRERINNIDSVRYLL